jgi:hypothetical protein
MSSIMTPHHARWADFRRRLLEACLAQECDGTPAVARELVAIMGCNVEASLAHLSVRGGYCDCTILFEVGDDEETKAARDMFAGWPSY